LIKYQLANIYSIKELNEDKNVNNDLKLVKYKFPVGVIPLFAGLIG